jgi:hypothetical protein
VTTQPEPSDATRVATRPKQRRKELVNATDNEMAEAREETVKAALDALGAGMPRVARHEMRNGMWRQWRIEDHRALDPETVAEQFTRAEREYSAAIHNRDVIARYGVRSA